MKKTMLCKYVAGSQSYGLATPQSDIDYRGVYVLDDVGLILDPFKYTGSRQKTEGDITLESDEMYHELRHFMNILRACNTNAVEMVFNTKWELMTPEFSHIVSNREQLIDPNKLFTSLKGYIMSELRFATGERTGKLGGKRFAQVQRLGFSPKNFVQLLRLCHAGTEFFSSGQFPVDISDKQFLRAKLLEIKCYPERFKKEDLVAEVKGAEANLDKTYHSNMVDINKKYKYDADVHADVLLKIYMPILERAKLKGTVTLWDWIRNGFKRP